MAEPSIIYLDPEADATLQIGKDEAREFHVSSKTLALASPYFAALFGPNFKEGIATRSGEKPCIALEDDDPGAMDTILKALHHQCADIPLEMELKELVQIAIHCDKYDCIKAMKPWTGNWCRFPQAGADSPQKMEDIGLALLAACLLRSANFETMTVHATKHLAGDFASIWANHDQLARIPEKLKATLVGGVRDMHMQLHRAILTTAYSLFTQATSCRTKTAEYHTTDARAGRFLRVFRDAQVPLSMGQFNQVSGFNVLKRFKDQVNREIVHRCVNGNTCSLSAGIETVQGDMERIIGRVRGISLEAALGG